LGKFKNIEDYNNDSKQILNYYLEEQEQNKIYEIILWKAKPAQGTPDTNIPNVEEVFIELPENEISDSLQNIVMHPNTVDVYILKGKNMIIELIRAEETTGNIKERCLFRLSLKSTNSKESNFRRIIVEEYETK
jgi:hypothetical protein